ncbi:CaiB/BaiF CoA transferase family protein [Pandoraea cepalis]|nr:CaiB/BaiF CoA-transferase family protein [Pandoraea cepalis]
MNSLKGVKVIDLTRALSGPFCSMILADMGADVVKVEAGPGGDMSRGWGPFDGEISTYYLSCNRNKRGICVDFRKQEGLDVLRALILQADVVLENFRPGTMEQMGLGFAELGAQKPSIIMGSITAYGMRGPLSSWPGFDQIAQGYSGLMSLTGFPEGDPTRTGTAIGDLSSGMWLSTAITGALFERANTGKGKHVTTSLLDSLVAMLSVHGQRYLSLGDVPKRTGNAHAVIAPYGVFQTADGPLNLAPITNEMWIRLCNLLGREDLLADARFTTNDARVSNRDALKAELESVLRTKGKQEWTAQCVAAGLPAGPINSLPEVFADPQVIECDLVETIAHPILGAVRQIPTPLAHADVAVTSNAAIAASRHPPLLGEHTFEVLREAGFDSSRIEQLLSTKVIFQFERKA